MQDRFKFRIWDNVNNKMAHLPRHFNAVMVNGTVCIVESFQNMNGFYKKKVSKEFDDAVLMQCTGLKDKKGKLIYENDIVKRNDDLLIVRYQEEMSCLAPQYFYLENDEIIYCGREWFEEYNNEDCKLYTSNLYEVIGNIYENPELLVSEEE